jgi:NAD+ synthetase
MAPMKIAILQVNTTVGDLTGNRERIADGIRRAEALGCDLAIFHELSLTGYPPRDLVEKEDFIRGSLEAVHSLAPLCARTAALVGFVDRNPSRFGKPVFNAAALLADGRLAGTYHKALLPTYDVFDEGRHFEPGAGSLVFERGGCRFGVTICEDIWNVPDVPDRRLYRTDPLERLRGERIDFLVNLSASPFSLHKEQTRRNIAASALGHVSRGLIYVNQVGGNDELIFDGSSFVVDPKGKFLARAGRFVEDLVVFDTDGMTGDVRPETDSDMEVLRSALCLGLRDYVAKCGFREVILGLSGGIDSSVVAALAVEALGPERVLGVLMPSIVTSAESVADASELAAALGIRTVTVPIAGVMEEYRRALEPTFAGRDPDVTEENLQARIRGNVLMALSNKFGHLLVNTGNKSELAMGYCTLYGDMNGGLSIIGDVPKTMVYPLGRRLNAGRVVIPERCFTKPPSAELRPGQRDDDSLPPYEVLDPILRMYVEENRELGEIAAAGYPAELVAEVIDRVDRNEYKRRQSPPVLRVTSKAFGSGRRLPVAQRYTHRA